MDPKFDDGRSSITVNLSNGHEKHHAAAVFQLQVSEKKRLFPRLVSMASMHYQVFRWAESTIKDMGDSAARHCSLHALTDARAPPLLPCAGCPACCGWCA
ncbi:unnamed protein product [Cuscuta europaea]|uniref:Uncharacterized protein n=1 Tax=Cuscuta europaea TaxID=41803 RepID=A0A9P0YJW2_CUSEU|nr:unnamed protein product [Cuscuta europaea]